MNILEFPVKPRSKRKAKRDRQYANTLIHYLGVEKALEVCEENTWNGVRKAIIEQTDAAVR